MIPISDPDLVRRRRPVVNIGLMALNILVFLYEFAIIGDDTRFVYTFGLIPAELTSGEDLPFVCALVIPGISEIPRVLCPPEFLVDNISTPGPTWITLFTSMFMHGGLLHIGSNMLYLWVFGDNIEDTLGHIPYLVFYLAAGLAAAGAQIMVDTQSQVPMVGASGAIAGVLGAYLVLHPRSRIRTLVIFYFIMVIHIPAVLLLGFWFFLQFFSGLGSLAAEGGGVAYWAHIGGFAMGVAVIGGYWLLIGRRRGAQPRTRWPPFKGDGGFG
ncbi:MAG: rhomboid family intramembrane serine protease [Chloroflexi bacterium]|nr:rhomboid family intramembrane serine protease [Chloroflexota bacterium]